MPMSSEAVNAHADACHVLANAADVHAVVLHAVGHVACADARNDVLIALPGDVILAGALSALAGALFDGTSAHPDGLLGEVGANLLVGAALVVALAGAKAVIALLGDVILAIAALTALADALHDGAPAQPDDIPVHVDAALVVALAAAKIVISLLGDMILAVALIALAGALLDGAPAHPDGPPVEVGVAPHIDAALVVTLAGATIVEDLIVDVALAVVAIVARVTTIMTEPGDILSR